MAEKTLKDFFVRIQRETLEVRDGPLGVNKFLGKGDENMKEYRDALDTSVDMALDAYVALMVGVEQ